MVNIFLEPFDLEYLVSRYQSRCLLKECQCRAMSENVRSGSIHIIAKVMNALLQKLSLIQTILQMESSKKQETYEDQNAELKKLYLERQQRSKQSSLDSFITSPTKQWKLENKPESASFDNNNLLLNYLIYDRRKPKPKQYIAMNALFNQNPNQLNIGFDTKKSIRSIFMTTFGFETQLLEPVAEIGCPFILANDKSDESQTTMRNYSGFKNWTVIFPEKRNKGYSVFHSKLWLIKFDKFLRVVIGTGNLHMGDWALWANAFWWKDFKPKAEKGSKASREDDFLANDFQLTLTDILSSIIPKGFDKKQLLFELSDYEFTGVDVILIPSIPGNYSDDGKYGISKIKKIVAKFNRKAAENRVTFTANTTSLGAIDEQFFKELYHSFIPVQNKEFRLQNVKLIYPTKQFIENETCGAAETLFLNQNNYLKSPILKEILYRYEDNPTNHSGGSIPHLKTIICSSQQDPNVTFYIGSHNLTKAAWGKSSTTKTGDKLAISNTELGLLYLDFDKQKLIEWLPFKFPPTRYSKTDRPFMRQ